jgi:UDP-N-acetylglucosamine 3-dehydrogenase
LAPTKLDIAVIGLGYWGRKLVGEYLSLSKKRDDVQLRYAVDCDKQRLASVGNEFGLPSNMLETDSSKVLKDDSVKAVHLATPNETHFPLGMAALEYGKHLLLEKPMALTTRDAFNLVRKAEQDSLLLHIGHIFRFNNGVREMRMLLNNGAIGRPLYFHLDWETLLEPPRGRDIIFDLGPHPVDVLNFLSDNWPSRGFVLARSFLRRKAGQEEVAQAMLEFEDDVFAHIAMSWLYAGRKRRHVSVTGESGTVELDAISQELTLYSRGGLKKHPVPANNTIESMITHFVNGILTGEEPHCSGHVGAMTVAVLSAMRESMRTERFANVFSS